MLLLRFLHVSRHLSLRVILACLVILLGGVKRGQAASAALPIASEDRLLIWYDQTSQVSQLTQDLQQLPVFSAANAYWLSLSPDGSRVAYLIGPEVVVRDLSSGVTAPIASFSFSAETTTGISWSPDGSHVAFTADGTIYIAAADGTEVTRLPVITSIGPAWSPDGQWIAYVPANSGSEETWRIHPDGTEASLWFTGVFGNGGPLRFSPSGDKLAGHCLGSTTICVFDVKTMRLVVDHALSDVVEVPPTSNGTGCPGDIAWSPDDKTLALTCFSFDAGFVAFLDTATGAVTIPRNPISGAASIRGTALTWIGPDRILPRVECASADATWHASNVTIPCSASDAGSGLADPTESSFNLSTFVAAGSEEATASTDSRQVCDLAGNCATAGPISGIKIDRKPPSVTIATPANAAYLLNELVAAAYACSDGGSGVASCVGTVANGTSITTNSVGTKTFGVDSSDNVGNQGSASQTYQVIYKIQLLYTPTKPQPAIVLQLLDANNVNRSSPATAVTARCVVPVGVTSCSNPIQSLNGAFTVSSAQQAYAYKLNKTGLKKGTQFNLLFMAQNDPVLHAAPFTA